MIFESPPHTLFIYFASRYTSAGLILTFSHKPLGLRAWLAIEPPGLTAVCPASAGITDAHFSVYITRQCRGSELRVLHACAKVLLTGLQPYAIFEIRNLFLMYSSLLLIHLYNII